MRTRKDLYVDRFNEAIKARVDSDSARNLDGIRDFAADILRMPLNDIVFEANEIAAGNSSRPKRERDLILQLAQMAFIHMVKDKKMRKDARGGMFKIRTTRLTDLLFILGMILFLVKELFQYLMV